MDKKYLGHEEWMQIERFFMRRHTHRCAECESKKITYAKAMAPYPKELDPTTLNRPAILVTCENCKYKEILSYRVLYEHYRGHEYG